VFSGHLGYRWDVYTQSPAPKTLLLLIGGEHLLGGIAGFDAADTTDENPERVAALRALVWAYLRSALHLDNRAWSDAVGALRGRTEPPATVETKE
jgi:hypothetical protein